jgi:3-dehydroquinate synthase/shikimate kinase/3-dehydroquinate synthase
MKVSKVLVKTKNKKYPIYIGNNLLDNLINIFKSNLPAVKKIAIIADKNLPTKAVNKLKISLKKFKPIIYRLHSVDNLKNIQSAMKLTESLLKNNFNRSDCVIAFGGGVIGDLSSFVSSITKRGINFVNIPTTLLAQADAAIGGKTGINSKQGKNLIGTFHQPEFVLIDLSLLKTLSHREMICGYGEILKHSLILDKKFFSWLTRNGNKVILKKSQALKYAIIKSCKIKAKIVELDERESNQRMILNFGHTFGHAFEAVKKFSRKLNHGEGVILGMIIASEISVNKKILPSKDYNLIKKHYINLKLPMEIKDYFNKEDIKKIIYFMKKDKKNFTNKINLILLRKIGKVFTHKIALFNIKDIEKILNSKISNYSSI